MLTTTTQTSAEKVRLILPWCCFAFALGLYLYTLAPTVTFVDSGELAAAVATRGVSHPSGSPLYLLLASFAAAIPFSTVIVRLNAFSAFCGATSAALVYLLFSQGQVRHFKMKMQPAGKSKKKALKEVTQADELPSGILLAGAVAASIAWTTDLGLWSTSTVTEVYALHAALLALLAMFLFLYSREFLAGNTAGSQRWLALGAVVTGLGLANYPPFGIVAPAIVTMLLRTEGWSFEKQWKRNAWMILFFLLGLLPYALLPLRASANPLLNWGNPSNWSRFWAHISAKQYQVFLSKPNLSVLSEAIPLWFRQWPAFLWLTVPFGIVGLARRRRNEFYFTVALALANFFYVLSYDISDVSSAPSDFALYLLPASLCTALWIGAGVTVILDLVRTRWNALMPWAYALALLPAVAIVSNHDEASHRRYTYAADFVRSVLQPAAPNALLLTSDWTFVSPAMYLQHVEHLRNDIAFFDVELLRRSWYYPYVRRRAPWLYEQAQPAIDAFLIELAKYEEGRDYNPDEITNRFVAMLNRFLEVGMQTGHPPYLLVNLQSKDADPDGYRRMESALGRPPFITVGVAPGAIGAPYQFVPETLAHRLYPAGSSPTLPSVNIPSKPFVSGKHYDAITNAIIARYAEFWRWRGDYLQKTRGCGEAEAAYRKALDLSPDLPEAVSGLSECSH